MKIKTGLCVLLLCAAACFPAKTAFAGSGMSTEVELIKESTPEVSASPAASPADASQSKKNAGTAAPVRRGAGSGAPAETKKTGGKAKTSSPATGDGRRAVSYILAMAVSAAVAAVTRFRRSGK